MAPNAHFTNAMWAIGFFAMRGGRPHDVPPQRGSVGKTAGPQIACDFSRSVGGDRINAKILDVRLAQPDHFGFPIWERVVRSWAE